MQMTFTSVNACFGALTVVFIVFLIHQIFWVTKYEARAAQSLVGLEDYSSPSEPVDKLLDGLLVPGLDETSCISRYQSASYRKTSPHKPSSDLLQQLRRYEDLHKLCGPYTKLYNQSLELLKSGNASSSMQCNYIVWIPSMGLGNRILTLASAFLYALLTNRVLLVDRRNDLGDLFCEPFPENSWLLPPDFPLNQLGGFNVWSSHSYGNMLKNNQVPHSNESLPSFLYLHLLHDYGVHDQMFFCDQDQAFLSSVPWLVIMSNNYFVPGLFLIPSFEQQLGRLFPDKQTVFHHLGRYLLHPSNQVWGLVTRYYRAYLAKADERIGIQVRVFDARTPPSLVMDQILACTLEMKLLPEATNQSVINAPPGYQKAKAVLMTSLNSGYYENLRNMYWEHPTVTGEVIGVYQPSHEERQHTEKKKHNVLAWAEIYLLSLTDVLVTSANSTFGYVAQGLAGIKPLIMVEPDKKTVPNPPCWWGISMEPCFHAPPSLHCKANRSVDTGYVVPHVRPCEDRGSAIKLV